MYVWMKSSLDQFNNKQKHANQIYFEPTKLPSCYFKTGGHTSQGHTMQKRASIQDKPNMFVLELLNSG